jgi:hypothetical protein
MEKSLESLKILHRFPIWVNKVGGKEDKPILNFDMSPHS